MNLEIEYWNMPFITLHEGEGGGGDAGGEAGGDAGGEAGGGGGAPKDFTPEQQALFNKKMAEQKRGFQQQITDLTGKLQSANLSAEATKAVEEELETVRASLRTAEEQAAHEQAGLKKKHKEQVEMLTTDRDSWQKRYTDRAINGDLMNAAANPDVGAYNPAQIVQLLRPITRLVAVKNDEGEETGEFVTQVTIELPNEKEEMVELLLTPADTVKRMSEATKLYGNLFKADATGGVGGKGSKKKSGGKDTSLAALAQSGDQDAYQKQRRKEKGLDK